MLWHIAVVKSHEIMQGLPLLLNNAENNLGQSSIWNGLKIRYSSDDKDFLARSKTSHFCNSCDLNVEVLGSVFICNMLQD